MLCDSDPLRLPLTDELALCLRHIGEKLQHNIRNQRPRQIMREVTPEEVGVLKLLKLAVEMDKFSQRLKAKGRDTYTLGELSEEIIMPVLKL